MITDGEKFFLVVPPGFEKSAVDELNEKLPGLDILSVEKGGVLLEAPFNLGLSFNLNLKIPTAVRLRIAEFKCRDFPKLFNRIQSLRWSRYLIGDAFTLSVECAKSRLLNEKRVEETVQEGLARFFAKQPPKKVKDPFAFTVHVRFFDDVCTISLDLSGEPLFKRGYKVMAGLAPLRENLAAGLFYFLWRQSGGMIETLIDPMCGTGTLLFESRLFYENIKMRDYAFEKRAEWQAAEVSNSPRGPKYFYGFDQNEKALESARGSVASVGEYAPKIEAENWHFMKNEVFDGNVPQIKSHKRAVICNPPYGERIKLPESPDVYYAKLFAALEKFEASHIGAVIPKTFARYWPKNAGGLKPKGSISFANGGIEVEFITHSR